MTKWGEWPQDNMSTLWTARSNNHNFVAIVRDDSISKTQLTYINEGQLTVNNTFEASLIGACAFSANGHYFVLINNRESAHLPPNCGGNECPDNAPGDTTYAHILSLNIDENRWTTYLRVKLDPLHMRSLIFSAYLDYGQRNHRVFLNESMVAVADDGGHVLITDGADIHDYDVFTGSFSTYSTGLPSGDIGVSEDIAASWPIEQPFWWNVAFGTFTSSPPSVVPPNFFLRPVRNLLKLRNYNVHIIDDNLPTRLTYQGSLVQELEVVPVLAFYEYFELDEPATLFFGYRLQGYTTTPMQSSDMVHWSSSGEARSGNSTVDNPWLRADINRDISSLQQRQYTPPPILEEE